MSATVLTDVPGELARTDARLREALGDEVVASLRVKCAHDARILRGNIEQIVADALSGVRSEAGASDNESPQARRDRVQRAVAAADPRRLHTALVSAIGFVFDRHAALVSRLGACDPRVQALASRFVVTQEVGAAVGGTVGAPLANVSPKLGEHARRVKVAMDSLRPGGTFGAILEGVGKVALSHGLAVMGVGRQGRRAAGRALTQGLGGSRYATFIEGLASSLATLHHDLIAVTPAIEARAEVAFLALHGGFLAAVAGVLGGAGVDLVGVSFATGEIALRLRPEAAERLCAWADEQQQLIATARASGDFANATRVAELALASTLPFSERWGVEIGGDPMPVAFNRERAAGFAAAMSGQPHATRALLAFHAIQGAPFWWAPADNLPAPEEFARDLLGFDAVVPDHRLNDAVSALAALSSRTANMRARTPTPSDEAVSLIRVLHVATDEPSVADVASPAVSAVSRVAADLQRRAEAEGVAAGRTARRLVAWRRAQLSRVARRAVAVSFILAVGIAVVVSLRSFEFVPRLPAPSLRAVEAQRVTLPVQAPSLMPSTAVDPILASAVPQIRRCVRRGRGAVELELRVAPNGEVVDADILGASVINDTQRACIRHAIEDLRFPSSSGDRLARASVDVPAAASARRSRSRVRGEVTADEFQ